MIKAKFSEKYNAMRSRIARLPKIIEHIALTMSKMDAVGIIKAFQDGIKNRTLNLIPLNPKTIQAKTAMGLLKPSTPLYGEGEGQYNSLINALSLRKIKNGYKVFFRWAKHHKADLSLRQLLAIHEAGAIIKRGNSLIRIPPRPAFPKAFNSYMQKKLKKENARKVQDAIRKVIKKNNIEYIVKIQNDFDSRLRKMEERIIETGY